ncbi:MAG TPA: hypothetical protein VNM48_16950 [Chloroflexota bacterium]|nr:hypothetical protein [Chloroflexota bacterium]
MTLERGGRSVQRPVLKTVQTEDGRLASAGRVVVRFQSGTDESAKTEAHTTASARASADTASVKVFLAPAAGPGGETRQVVTLPPQASLDEAVRSYREDSRVLTAEPDYVMRRALTPNDPSLSQQWGLTRIGAQAAWDVSRSTLPSV